MFAAQVMAMEKAELVGQVGDNKHDVLDGFSKVSC
jgi:hypothetical protein